MLKFNIPPYKEIRLNLYAVYLIPLFIGLIARLLFFRLWLKSPFRYYHTLVGLDMRKFLIYGENFYHGKTIFSPYRLFIAAIYAVTGKEHLPETVVFCQIIMGLMTILLTIYIALTISGKRSTALFAGLFMSLYAPVIIYETQILKASIFLFLPLLSLASLLYARKKQFSLFSTFFAGVLAALPLLERYSGWLWLFTSMAWIAFYCRIKIVKKCGICLKGLHRTYKDFKPLMLFAIGASVALLAAATVNKINQRSSVSYFMPNYKYILSTGADIQGDISEKGNISPEIKQHKTLSPSKKASLVKSEVKHYLIKAFYIFNTLEIPNNINYYFIKKKFSITRFLIGPALLIPLTLTGLILMIFYGGLNKKESVLFFYIMALVIPICVFLPLGRYKLVLAPVFCIAAGYAISYFIRIFKHRNDRVHNILTPALLTFFFFLTISTVSYPERNSDEKAYGQAAVYVPVKLMHNGKYHKAAEILAGHYRENQENSIININFASALLGCNRIKNAEFVLINSGIPKNTKLHTRYFYELGETYRMLAKYKKALFFYQKALKTTSNITLKQQINKQIKKTTSQIRD